MTATAPSLKATSGQVGKSETPDRVSLDTRKWVLSEGDAPPAQGVDLGSTLMGDEEAQKAAIERFRLIEPLVNPSKYPELYERFKTRCELIDHLAAESQVTTRTVRRWLDQWSDGGIAGLTRKGRCDKSEFRVLNLASRRFILSAYLPERSKRGALSVKEALRIYEEERGWREARIGKVLSADDQKRLHRYVDSDGRLLAAARLSEAHYSTFCRFLDSVADPIKVLGRKGSEAFQNTEVISHRALASIDPLEYLVLDHRILDIFCLIRAGKGWKLARPWITCAIDMRTRKWLGWCIVEVPSSDSIATVLKRVFIDHGLPKGVYLDNGSDFTCEWFEGKRSVKRDVGRVEGPPSQWTGVFESLGIRVLHAIVRRARSKIIEPNFNRISKFDETLPEFCGHKPTQRPEVFATLLKQHKAWEEKRCETTPFRTIQEIAALYDDAIADLNERELAGEGMRKVIAQGYGWWCPNEAWEILSLRVVRRTVPPDILQLLFAKRREVTVRNGEITVTFAGEKYHYRFPEAPASLLELNGWHVTLAYDPLDLENGAVYLDGRFLGIVSCVELRRMGESDFVQDEKVRRAFRREAKKFIDCLHQAEPVPDAATHFARRQEVLPQRSEPARPEVPLEIPAAIAEAHAALVEASSFSFAGTVAEIASEKRPEPIAVDDEFRFFSDDSEGVA